MNLRSALLLSLIILVGGQASTCADEPITGDPQIDALISEAGDLHNKGETGIAAQKANDAALMAKARYGKKHPIYGTALYLHGSISMLLQNFDVADRELKESLDIRTSNLGEHSLEVAHTLRTLGILALSQKRPNESLSYLSKAAAIYEKTPEGRKHLTKVLYNQAVVIDQSSDPLSAELAWRKVIKSIGDTRPGDEAKNLEHSAAWNNLGMVLSRQGKSHEAINAFNKAIYLSENSGGSTLRHQTQLQRSSSYRELGMEYSKIGQNDKAAEAYDASWRYADLDSMVGRWVAGSALYRLAALDIDASRMESANDHLHHALEIMKGHPAESELKELVGELMKKIKAKPLDE